MFNISLDCQKNIFYSLKIYYGYVALAKTFGQILQSYVYRKISAMHGGQITKASLSYMGIVTIFVFAK